MSDRIEPTACRRGVGRPRTVGTMRAFTLIELLVVVTIIAVLLALLTPALDSAVYQAELASCGASLDMAATGFISYASANRRVYPHRNNASGTNVSGNHPRVFGAGIDLRPMLRDTSR